MKYYPLILTILGVLCFSCSKHQNDDSIIAIQIQDRNGLTETFSNPEKLENFQHADFLTSQPYKKILRIFKSNGKTFSKITTYHPNGKIWQYLEAEELRAHGAYKEWFSNGQIRIDAFVIGGVADVAPEAQKDWLFDGSCKIYNESGTLIALINYKAGALDGPSTYYYASGKIEKILPYISNVIEGESIEYFPQGTIKSKTKYKMGNKQGKSLGFFENQNLAWDETYNDNLLIEAFYYNNQKELLSTVEEGQGFKALFDGDKLSYLVQINQGFAEGGVKQYSNKGELISTYFVKNGKKNGIETIYFQGMEKSDYSDKTLQPKMVISWSEGRIHGSVKTWYNNGQMQSQREFCQNKKTGPSLSWYKDGSLMLVEEYEQDKLQKGQYYKKNALDSISSITNGSGIASLFDENGIFIRKVSYIRGEAVDPESP